MNNSCVLVTGASSDIGLALLDRLLSREHGPIVAHCHSGSERIDALRTAKAAGRLVSVQADFASFDAVESLIDDVAARFGAPRAIVHLPALPLRYERVAKFDLQRFDRDMMIQVRSMILIARRFAPLMAKSARSRIVFLLSSVTRGPVPRFMSSYAVVKHAQLGLMRALASEYSATGMTVNAVSPGMVATRFLDEIPEIAREASAAAVPRGRLAVPEDVIGAIDFLLSDASDYITGIELPVTGGSTS